jgi:receptor expression-enhancing protein 1/2/3/4
VYDTFFRPYLSRHETRIDRHLLEMHTRASDIASLFFQRFATYGQSRIYEVLEYVASQSNTSSGSRNFQVGVSFYILVLDSLFFFSL